MRTAILILLLLVTSSCRSPVAPAAPSVVTAVPSEARSPLSSQWEVRELGEGRARLTLSVTKAVVTEKDVRVDFTVPPGVTAQPALEPWTIAAETRGVVSKDYSLEWSAAPRDDLIAVVDVQGVSFGYHAKVPFRFGRPEPTVKPPERDANPVQLGNTNLGRPVDLTK